MNGERLARFLGGIFRAGEGETDIPNTLIDQGPDKLRLSASLSGWGIRRVTVSGRNLKMIGDPQGES